MTDKIGTIYISAKKLTGYRPALIPHFYSRWKGPMPPEMEADYKRILQTDGEPLYQDVLIPINPAFIMTEEVEA